MYEIRTDGTFRIGPPKKRYSGDLKDYPVKYHKYLYFPAQCPRCGRFLNGGVVRPELLNGPKEFECSWPDCHNKWSIAIERYGEEWHNILRMMEIINRIKSLEMSIDENFNALDDMYG